MKIPSRFELMGMTFTVAFVDDDYINMRAGGADVWGLFIPAEQKILLRSPREGLSEQQVMQTFCHELFHALFWSSNYSELGEDEKLVDQMGHLLLQFIKTFQY